MMSFGIRRSFDPFEERKTGAFQPTSFKLFDVVNAATTTVFISLGLSRAEPKNKQTKQSE